MWVAGVNKLYAYALATGQRDPGKDFDTLGRNEQPRGIWSDGTTMWVTEPWEDMIYAYALATGERDPVRDFTNLAAQNSSPFGLWSDGTTMWVADLYEGKIYAYALATGQRDSDRDFNTLTAAGNTKPGGLWSDGTTMWVADVADDTLRAYALATGARDSDRDFTNLKAAGNTNPAYGLWSDGTTMWVTDEVDGKLYAYNMPGNADLSALILSAGALTPTFNGATTSYTALVENSASTITVTPTTNDSNATFEFLDGNDAAIPDTDGAAGHQVSLSEGDNIIKVQVTSQDGNSTRTYTVTVNRAVAVSVSFESSSYTVREGSSVTVTLSLDKAPGRQVVVPLIVTTGSGVTGGDYSGVPSMVAFAPGDTSTTFSFSAGDDAVDEDDEAVTVAFGTLPDGVGTGSPATAAVTIADDDDPNWAVSLTPASIAEENETSATVTVSTGGVTFTEPKTIMLGFAGAATETADYTVTTKTLTLAAGQSSVSTMVTAVDDAVSDADESIEVTATLGGAVIGTQRTIAIADNDAAAAGIVLTVAPTEVGEGASATTLTVTGTLDGSALTTNTQVSLTLAAGTATETADYTVTSTTATLTITAATTSGTATFSLTPVDDQTDETDETVTIEATTTSTLTLSPSSLTVTITDNDEPNAVPVFSPSSLTRSVAENTAAGTAVGGPVTATDGDGDSLTYSLDGTADAASFSVDSGTGQVSTVSGVTYDHEAAKNTYSVTVTADDDNGGAATATVTINITDENEPPEAPAPPTASAAPGSITSLDVSWTAPDTSDKPAITDYDVQYRGTVDTNWTDWELANPANLLTATTITGLTAGAEYEVQVRATNDEGTSRWSASGTGSAGAATEDSCSGGGFSPVPTEVEVEAVPIVVESTTAEYFVLYVKHDADNTVVRIPVAVIRGEAGTTTLAENVAALPKERYQVEKYLVADPADVDGDCIDDITELEDLGTMNPVNPAPAIELIDGAVAVPSRVTFETLSYNQQYVKFALLDMDTDRPILYFINSTTHVRHPIVLFLEAIGHSGPDLPWSITGEIAYHPELLASDGSPGVYYYWLNRYDNRYTFSLLARFHALLAAGMPLLEDNLALYIPNYRLPSYQSEMSLLRESRIPLVFDEDIHPETDFLALNQGEGYGLLRVMEPDERPNPRDVVIYESLPNELPRVAGIITTVPQTPLSHVNLRAVQDGVPNAFIADALDDTDVDDLIDSYVRYTVTEEGWTLRAATPAEVDAHYASSRPAAEQTPERDLSVTEITPLSDIGFEDWTAFGVKAANVAVLGTLGFPEGTVPDGFAVPFYFYDEFIKHNELYDDIEEMLADPDFQTDFDVQEDELKKLRKKIKKGETPDWIIAALEEMHATYPEGQSLRYRSSTNNEDLPGFSGAGLYDSKTQDPEETEEDGIDKSIKGVWESLWNFRAFTEREFHRIDHLAAAMGVLVHPNYSDELANGVAVSFDPIRGYDGYYYVNTQLGEDLVTNPDALSEPEEILLHRSGDYYEILATSNQIPPGELLMSDDQLDQLGEHLAAIHEKFAELYSPEPGDPFAMEIEFKITSDDILAIKQARPWVFSKAPNNLPTGAPTITGTPQVGETLTAETRDITDADGLSNAVFSYQWLANDADINGATGASYTLVAADEGKAIKVKVSFTDDQNNHETLTSAATAAVDPDPGPITGFTVVDAFDQSVEGTLADGGTLALDDPDGGSFGIRADLESGATIGSVGLQLTGAKTHDQTENIAPYSLYGDSGGNLSGESLPVGEYTLTATAYSEARLGGNVLGTLKVSFSVTETATQQPNTPATGASRHQWHGAGGRDAHRGHLRD